MADSTELLNRCAEQLGRAQLEIHRLTEENHRLHLLHYRLWMALAYWACSCREATENLNEVLVVPTDHAEGCEYRGAYSGIKEAVER